VTDLAIPGLAYAEANWGRWVAHCPAGLCMNAVQLTRWQQRFECSGPGGCGWTSRITWPVDPEAIEVLLAMRPDMKTRNWVAGETLQDLLQENAVHDVLPPAWLVESGCILETRNERVTAGRLVAACRSTAAVRSEPEAWPGPFPSRP
jgi:hypothetical protein